MTKLSEIGERFYPVLGGCGDPEAYTIISDEERRELVKGMIRRFIDKYLMGWKQEDWKGDEYLKEFLKDEGL